MGGLQRLFCLLQLRPPPRTGCFQPDTNSSRLNSCVKAAGVICTEAHVPVLPKVSARQSYSANRSQLHSVLEATQVFTEKAPATHVLVAASALFLDMSVQALGRHPMRCPRQVRISATPSPPAPPYIPQRRRRQLRPACQSTALLAASTVAPALNPAYNDSGVAAALSSRSPRSRWPVLAPSAAASGCSWRSGRGLLAQFSVLGSAWRSWASDAASSVVFVACGGRSPHAHRTFRRLVLQRSAGHRLRWRWS